MHKKNWTEELKELHDLDINEDADLQDEERFEDEGPMAAFEEAADHAYDEEFLKEDADGTDWFEDE